MKNSRGTSNFKIKLRNWTWWYSPLIPVLGRQKEKDLCEFKDSQGCIVRHCLNRQGGKKIAQGCLNM